MLIKILTMRNDCMRDLKYEQIPRVNLNRVRHYDNLRVTAGHIVMHKYQLLLYLMRATISQENYVNVVFYRKEKIRYEYR